MASVEFVNVEKRFGDTTVVKGVSLSVADGEFLVLVGPSGCGKSTCLRMIAGLEEVTDGQVKIGGQVVNEMAPKDRDIGMVFQSYALYPHMSVRQNLAFGLTLRKMSGSVIEERVTEVAQMLELSELLDRRPRQLSGGQRQRVAIGRSIVRQPQVFLFDEPLSNLDAALRVQMRGEIAGLHRRLGTTMIYVTHDQVEAMTLANRIAVLNRGELQQAASPMELYEKPANQFVAGFIGSPSMNFVRGELTSGENGLEFHAPGMQVELPGVEGEAGRQVALGIRPHDLGIGEQIRGKVTVVEPMGWEAFIHVFTEAGTLVARAEGDAVHQIRTGDTVSLGLNRQRVYVFDEDGTTVQFPDAGAKAA